MKEEEGKEALGLILLEKTCSQMSFINLAKPKMQKQTCAPSIQGFCLDWDRQE